MNLFDHSQALFETSRLLHGTLSTDLTLVTAEEIEMSQRKREKFKIELDEMLRVMAKEVHHIEDIMSLLRIEKRTHTVDIKELETAKWNSIKAEKDSKKPTRTSDDL